MQNLAEEIQRILISLEDARDEGDWESISTNISDLENIYIELDRQENGFDFDYE